MNINPQKGRTDDNPTPRIALQPVEITVFLLRQSACVRYQCPKLAIAGTAGSPPCPCVYDPTTHNSATPLNATPALCSPIIATTPQSNPIPIQSKSGNPKHCAEWARFRANLLYFNKHKLSYTLVYGVLCLVKYVDCLCMLRFCGLGLSVFFWGCL